MKKAIWAAAGVSVLFRGSHAQPASTDARVDWLKSNSAVIRSIDHADEDYSDLSPLKAAIGSARVVMLGEQSHGDGATFKAKCRLVKFLHKEMGFTVLAWESGFFDCRFVDEAFRRGEPASTAHENGIFGIWMLSEEVFPAVEYAAATYKTDNPLIIAGFDSQFTSGKGQREFPGAIGKKMAKLGQDGKAAQSAAEAICAWLDAFPANRAPEEPASAIKIVRDMIELLGAAPAGESATGAAERAEARRLLENLLAFQRQLATSGAPDKSETGNVRDQAMGETLIHLANVKYPERKIIVWAASMHNIRNVGKVRLRNGPSYETIFPMGDWAHATLGDEVYSIMFTAARGKAGIAWAREQDIGEPEKNSFEDLLDRVGSPLLFLDFKQVRAGSDPASAFLREPFAARPLGYAWADGRWCECFDGVIYTEDMTRSTRRTARE